MAISRTQAASANSTSVSITTPTKGDLILVFAYRAASAIPPTVATGYNTIVSGGANTNSEIVGWKIAAGTETTSGTWTNASSVECLVYRGVNQALPIGASIDNGGSSATLSYTGITLQVTDGTSWVVGFAGNRTSLVNTAPTGMTSETHQTTVIASDTNAGATSWSTQTVAGNSNTGWRTVVIEIVAPNAGTPQTLVQFRHAGVCGGGPSTGDSGNAFKFVLPNPTLAGNCLVLTLCYAFNAARTISITDNKSNTWPSPSVTTTDAGNVITTGIWVLPNAATGTQTLTITFDATINDVYIEAAEFYNIATSSAVNGTHSNNADAGPAVTAGSFTPTSNNGNGGNLIYSFHACVSGVGLGPSNVTLGMRGGPAFTVLGADYNLCCLSQTSLQTTAAAINPTAIVDIPLVDTFNCVAVALKVDATKGTAATGMRIVRHVVVRADTSGNSNATASPITFGFPSSGNLLVGVLDVTAVGNAFSSASDSNSNTWSVVSTSATSVPQPFYAGNATSGIELLVTLNWTSAGATSEFHFYDIAGAATSPFDVEADFTDTGAAVTGAISGYPTITPTTSGGIVVAALNLGTGPCSAVGTTGGTFDNTVYTNESDASSFNNGDAWQHVNNAPASAISFKWTLAASTTPGSVAVAFKAAPAVSDTIEWRGCYPPARGRDDGNIGYNLG